MKKVIYMCAGLLLAASAGAGTILIDYNDGVAGDGHDASVLAGDFDSLAATTGAGWDFSLGGNVAEWRDDNESGVGSKGNLVIGKATNGGSKVPGIDTGTTIALGQTFDLSFMWRDASQWTADNTVSMVFFYTDTDAIDGAATDVLTLTSTAADAASDWDTESATAAGYDVDVTSAVGKSLFVRFDTDADAGQFARLDNVSVSVIPEPATMGLLGLGAVGLLAFRRRMR